MRPNWYPSPLLDSDPWIPDTAWKSRRYPKGWMALQEFDETPRATDVHVLPPCPQSQDQIQSWKIKRSSRSFTPECAHWNENHYSIITEKAMATHSSTLAWKIPWTEEPGGLQSMMSLRVRHDWAASLSLFPFMHWRRICNPLQCSFLENPSDRGTWGAAVCGVAQSRTRLQQLSSRSIPLLKTISSGNTLHYSCLGNPMDRGA